MFIRLLIAHSLLCFSLVNGGIFPGPAGVAPNVINQMDLDAECVANCRTEVCYLADKNDCRRFITCDQGARDGYHATVQPCAFGTYWAGTERTLTCDIPQNVNCSIDYCAGRRLGENYEHMGNCRAFWSCGSKGPVAMCCDEGHYFDATEKKCLRDIATRCRDKCPIKKDVCQHSGVATEYFADGNCRTYWDCEDKRPHPVCCPEGQGYDIYSKKCEINACKDPCPVEYQPDICQRPGITRYTLHDGHCRTYMKCAAGGQEERWCCRPNFLFNTQTQQCEEYPYDSVVNCNTECPPSYREECHLGPGSSPKFFTLGNVEMPCPSGTVFDMDTCSCGRHVEGAQDNSCNMELNIQFDFPGWNRSGSQRAIEINQLGTVKSGARYNKRETYAFDGNLLFRVMFFRQAFPNLYLNLVYRPDDASMNGQKIVLSNCMNTYLGGPSLELFLQDGRINLVLVTDSVVVDPRNPSQQTYATALTSVAFTPGRWNRYRAVYNGDTVYTMNQVLGNPPVRSAIDTQPLNGTIPVAVGGLDIGRCFMKSDRQTSGFTGSIGELQFTKCLRQEWIDSFNVAASSIDTFPANPSNPNNPSNLNNP